MGAIGFGGPPTHIVLLRAAVRAAQGLDPRRRVRGRDRGVQPAARAGLDPARDVLRRPGGRRAGRVRGRRRLHPPGAGRDPRAGGAVPVVLAAGLGAGGRRRGRRRRRRGRGARPRSTWPGRRGGGQEATAAHARWIAYAARAPPRARSSGPGSCWCCSAAAVPRWPCAGPRRTRRRWPRSSHAGGLGSLAWTALKVGALSFGGGFVIVPLMQADAVSRYHWMTGPQFLDAVALGQVTPGPVVCTVAMVGYAAGGLGYGAARGR